MSNRKTNRALKTTFTTLEMMETTIGVLEFCIPMNQPCMAKSDMEAGAAQMRAKKYSAASARAPSLPCISPSGNLPHGVAQQNEKQGQHDGHGHGTDEDVGTFAQVAGSVGLCRDAARSHAQETARPVYHVEYRRSDADGAYCGGTVAQPARYRRIDHAQQGDGDVGYDVWDGESQYSPVH